jgi:hypothetical protein
MSERDLLATAGMDALVRSTQQQKCSKGYLIVVSRGLIRM